MALEIESIDLKEIWRLNAKGEVDLYTSPQLRQALLQAMTKATSDVLLDLSQIAYMDSSGVATLIEGLKQSGKNGVKFALVAPSQSVMKVLQLSKLDTVFDIREAGG